MADISHVFGQDFQISAVGGLLAEADGSELVQQRVIRRLLTSEGDNLYALSYGAGVAQFLGKPAQDRRIAAVIRRNMREEAGVDQTKPIIVEVYTNPQNGVTYAKVQYTDKINRGTYELNLPLFPASVL